MNHPKEANTAIQKKVEEEENEPVRQKRNLNFPHAIEGSDGVIFLPNAENQL